MSKITIQSNGDNSFRILKSEWTEFEVKAKNFELEKVYITKPEFKVRAKQAYTKETLFWEPIENIEVDGVTYTNYEELSEVLTPILFKKGGGSGGGGTTYTFTNPLNENGGSVTISNASSLSRGTMSSADFTKLSEFESANNYYKKTEVYNKEEVDSKLTAVYKTKGSVNNFASLPTTGNLAGDVWNLLDTGDNYVWVTNLNNTGNPGWDKLSGIVDLSAYHTITQYQNWVNSNYTPTNSFTTSTSSSNNITGNSTPGSPLTVTSIFDTMGGSFSWDKAYSILQLVDNSVATIPFNLTTTAFIQLPASGKYAYVNGNLLFGKKVVKLNIVPQSAGTLTVYASKNFSSQTGNYADRILEVINLVLNKTEYLVSWQLASDETLSFGSPTDTGAFRYISGSPNSAGGQLLSRNHNTGVITTFNNNMNIGVYVEGGTSFGYDSQRIINLENKTTVLETSSSNYEKFKGKKISFIGDSITTFNGLIVSGNVTKYPFADVTTADQTWWRILLTKLGATIGINDSWSGSKVSSGGSAGSSVQNRLNRIGTGNYACFVFMGTNDFGNSVPLGTIDFTTAFDVTEFTDAYCNMVQTLITNYPTVKFYFLLPMKRNTSDNSSTFPKTNTLNLTIDDYNNRIIEICKIYGVEWIDLRKVGFNQFNHTSYSTDGLHPNALGMQLLANFVYQKIM